MSHARSLLRISVFALLAATLLALPLAGPLPSAEAEEQVQIQFGEEEVLMDDFLKAVARVTKQTLVWNPSDKQIRGKKLIGGVSLSAPPGELMDAVRALLTFYELVMIPVGPADHEIVLVADARMTSTLVKLKPQHVVLTEENLDKYAHKDGLFITTTITVEHIQDLRGARNALTRIVTGQNIGSVSEIPSASAFVVTDFAPNVVAIYRLLEKMDHPSAASSTTSAETEAVVLEHTQAEEVVALLEHQFGTPEQTQAGRNPQGAPPQRSAPRVVADERTNRVFVTGTFGQIATVKAVIALLDIPVTRPVIESHVIALKHIASSEAAMVLTNLTRASQELYGLDRSQIPLVIAHQETNAVVVAGPPAAIQQIRTLVAAMDVETK